MGLWNFLFFLLFQKVKESLLWKFSIFKVLSTWMIQSKIQNKCFFFISKWFQQNAKSYNDLNGAFSELF